MKNRGIKGPYSGSTQPPGSHHQTTRVAAYGKLAGTVGGLTPAVVRQLGYFYPPTQLGVKMPINVERLVQILEGYPQKDTGFELFTGFAIGFSLHYKGCRVKRECLNMILARENENEALRLVRKEVSLGRMAGPFKEPPFFNMKISPIGLIPKKDKSFRLIQHLSYP